MPLLAIGAPVSFPADSVLGYTFLTENGPNRRLAAIMAIDVVEYSRLAGADGEGTVSALRRSRSELLDPLITRDPLPGMSSFRS